MGSSQSSVPHVECGYHEMQGRRPTMEDALLVPASEEGDFEAVFGVFDGHNGPECSNFLKTHFLDALKHQKELSSGDPEQVEIAIKKAAAEVDHSFLQCARKSCWASGSTGVVVVWRGNDLWVANTGDSRAIAVVKGKAVPLTTDHKPHLAEEAKRIEEQGGTITDGRLQGQLAMTRAYGNPSLKASNYLISEPEVSYIALHDNISFIVLATDGLWDVMSSSRVAKQIYTNQRYYNPTQMAELLANEAHHRGSSDNISVIILKFEKGKPRANKGKPILTR